MALVFNDDLNFSVNVKVQLPDGWKDLTSNEVLGKVEDPDATWPAMDDDEWYEPKITISIVGETDPQWTRTDWGNWSPRVEEDEENPTVLVESLEEEDQLYLTDKTMRDIANLVDDYTRYLADVRYNRLPTEDEEAPAE